MNKIFAVLFCTFLFFGSISVARASWWDDVTGFAEDVECIIDLDIDLQFQFGDEAPVFDGPGLKKGARLVRCQLDQNVSKEKDLKKLIVGWMNFLLGLTAVLAVVAFVWAGFTYVSAMGDDSRVETAKNTILYTVIGILLILGSYAIVNTLMNARFGTEGGQASRGIHYEISHFLSSNKNI